MSKWPILCQVGCKTLTQSINQSESPERDFKTCFNNLDQLMADYSKLWLIVCWNVNILLSSHYSDEWYCSIIVLLCAASSQSTKALVRHTKWISWVSRRSIISESTQPMKRVMDPSLQSRLVARRRRRQQLLNVNNCLIVWVAGYILRWYVCLKAVIHPSINWPIVRRLEIELVTMESQVRRPNH